MKNMNDQKFLSALQSRINQLISISHTPDKQVLTTTNIPAIELFQMTENMPKSPAFYKPGIVILGNGKKFVYFDSKKTQYNPSQCLIVVAPIAVECELEADPDNPLNGIFINLDPSMLYEVSTSIGLGSLKKPLLLF